MCGSLAWEVYICSTNEKGFNKGNHLNHECDSGICSDLISHWKTLQLMFQQSEDHGGVYGVLNWSFLYNMFYRYMGRKLKDKKKRNEFTRSNWDKQ